MNAYSLFGYVKFGLLSKNLSNDIKVGGWLNEPGGQKGMARMALDIWVASISTTFGNG